MHTVPDAQELNGGSQLVTEPELLAPDATPLELVTEPVLAPVPVLEPIAEAPAVVDVAN